MLNFLKASPNTQKKVVGVVFNTADFPYALEMRDLYLECVSHLLQDDMFRFHVLMMPGMWGEHFTVTAGDDPDLDAAVERMTGSPVGPMDCIAVLGRDVLTNLRSEDEMTELVVADIARHVNRLWPVADRSSGWVGPHLGRTAVAGMLSMAHPVMRSASQSARIKDEVLCAMVSEEYRYSSVDGLRRENGPAVEAVDLICDRVAKTNGEFLSLPVRIADLIDAGRSLLSSVLDDMEVRPVGVI
jgi:hypothetical protein